MRYKFLINHHNKKLAEGLMSLKRDEACTGSDLELFDTRGVFSELAENPKFKAENMCISEESQVEKNFFELTTSMKKFLFFDEHPTTKVHCILAVKVHQFLQSKNFVEGASLAQSAEDYCNNKYLNLLMTAVPDEDPVPSNDESAIRVTYQRGGQSHVLILDEQGTFYTSIDFGKDHEGKDRKIQFHTEAARTVVKHLVRAESRPPEVLGHHGCGGYDCTVYFFPDTREKVTIYSSDVPVFEGIFGLRRSP